MRCEEGINLVFTNPGRSAQCRYVEVPSESTIRLSRVALLRDALTCLPFLTSFLKETSC